MHINGLVALIKARDGEIKPVVARLLLQLSSFMVSPTQGGII